MIDILKDIVKHTHGLGFLDLVKITGDSNETAIDSMAEDRSVILQGSFHKPQAEMSGTFGMPQMGKLDIHLKCPEYKDKAANTEHNSFVVRTDNGNLIFTFGDQASHGGEFTFATDVKGTLNKGWSWPVGQVLQILKLSDSAKVMLHFSNEGAMMVSVDSGLGKYQYIIPAQAQ